MMEDSRARTLRVVRRGAPTLYSYADARAVAVAEFGEAAVLDVEANPLPGDPVGFAAWKALWNSLDLTNAVNAHEARCTWVEPICDR